MQYVFLLNGLCLAPLSAIRSSSILFASTHAFKSIVSFESMPFAVMVHWYVCIIWQFLICFISTLSYCCDCNRFNVLSHNVNLYVCFWLNKYSRLKSITSEIAHKTPYYYIYNVCVCVCINPPICHIHSYNIDMMWNRFTHSVRKRMRLIITRFERFRIGNTPRIYCHRYNRLISNK